MYCPHCDESLSDYYESYFYDEIESRWNGTEGYQFDLKCPYCKKTIEAWVDIEPIFNFHKKQRRESQ